jgi:hypothetical protein
MANESSPLAEKSIMIGSHFATMYAPDTLICRSNGDVSVTEVRALLAFLQQHPTPDGGFFYLSNLTNLRHQTQQAVEEVRKFPENLIRACAIVGAKFSHRVLLDGLTRVGRFFKIGLVHGPIEYFATEEEALAWFDQLRR